jgi:hypothetical protein
MDVSWKTDNNQNRLVIVISDKLFDYLCRCKDGKCQLPLAIPLRWNTQMNHTFEQLKTIRTYDVIIVNKSRSSTRVCSITNQNGAGYKQFSYLMRIDRVINSIIHQSHSYCLQDPNNGFTDRQLRNIARKNRARRSELFTDLIKEMYKDEPIDTMYTVVYSYPKPAA